MLKKTQPNKKTIVDTLELRIVNKTIDEITYIVTFEKNGSLIIIILAFSLTHWGRVMHICVSKLTTIASDNGLSPDRRQAIIWTNVGILLIWNLRTNFSEILFEIHIFSFKKMHLKMSSAKCRPFCPRLNVLIPYCDCVLHMYIIKHDTSYIIRKSIP